MKLKDLFNCAVYIRLSREDGDKAESDSIGNQRKLIAQYMNSRDDLLLYDTYIDDGFTGTNFKRPSFQRMIADIESGNINCVIVKDLSRFGRDYIETGRYLERYFPDHDIRFISISDNIDSAAQVYDMLMPIKNLFNEQYARDISKKVYASVQTKQKAGDFIGAFPSYGYKKSPLNKNRLIVDEEAAAVVRRIFSLYLEGHGKQGIARILNEEGIPCPSEYKRLHGDNYTNCNRLASTSYWTYSTIKSMLQNEIYIGNMVQGKKHQSMKGRQRIRDKQDWIIVPNTHEAIIDMDIWNKVQSLLGRQYKDIDLVSNRNIFAGFLKCGDCGRSLMKISWKLVDNSFAYAFKCGTYKRNGKKFCTPHTISCHALEQIILNDLNIIIQNIENLQELVESQEQELYRTQISGMAVLERLETELSKIKRLKKSVYEDYKENLISREELIEYRTDYQKQEERLTRQIEAQKCQNTSFPGQNLFRNPWIARLLDLKEIKELDRNIVVEMIDEILVYENHKIKIRYNFTDELKNLFPESYAIQEKEQVI